MRRVAILSALVFAAIAILGYQHVTALDIESLGDDLFVLTGFGGNVAVLRSERGSVIVDTLSFRVQGDRIREQAEALVEGPVLKVVNTHYHFDHTHGNTAFPEGTEIIATERTRASLLSFDPDYWEGDKAAFLPTKTFRERHEFLVGAKTVRVLYLGRGHTAGDALVHFVDERALHFGDLFFNDCYPNIDLEAGGSVVEWVETLDRALEIDFDHAIPGHGRVGTREDVVAFQDFLTALVELGASAAREGWSLAETQRQADLLGAEGLHDDGYQSMGIPGLFYLDRNFVVRRVWEEATDALAEDSP